jgi:pimeloyl-ACP methyl ester carboxylesterase
MLRAGGWSTPAFRSIFTALFLPDADPFAARAFDEMQRVAGDDEDVANFLDAVLADDLSELAPGVRAPTRTVHLREDQIVPYAEGRRLASLIPGAELVTLEGRNHALSPGEPAMEGLHDQMADFFRIEPAP